MGTRRIDRHGGGLIRHTPRGRTQFLFNTHKITNKPNPNPNHNSNHNPRSAM